MSTEKNSNQPLAEVFGFSIDNQSERAVRYSRKQTLPFQQYRFKLHKKQH